MQASSPSRSMAARTRPRRRARRSLKAMRSRCSSIAVPRLGVARRSVIALASLERGVTIGGQLLETGLGDVDDLLAAIAADAVAPYHRLQHEDHARSEHVGIVERPPQIGADNRRLRAVYPQAVAQIVVSELVLLLDFLRGPYEIARRGAGPKYRVDLVHQLAPTLITGAKLRRRLGIDGADPGLAEIGMVAVPGDAGVGEDEVAFAQEAVIAGQWKSDVAIGRDRAAGDRFRRQAPDRIDDRRRRAKLETALEEDRRQLVLTHAGLQRRLDVDHRDLVDALGLANAGDFVSRLLEARAQGRHGAVAKLDPPKKGRQARQHRAGQLVEPDAPCVRQDLPHGPRQRIDAGVELDRDRRADIVARDFGHHQLGPSGPNMRRALGRDYCDDSLVVNAHRVRARLADPGIFLVGGADEYEAVQSMGRHRIGQAREPCRPHALEVDVPAPHASSLSSKG